MKQLSVFVLLIVSMFGCGSGPSDAATFAVPSIQTSSGGVNPINLASCTQTRTTGIAPLTVFFDCTAATDTAVVNPLRDVVYSWSFGDTGSSGTGTWTYGSRPSSNSMNAANGFVVAHVFNVAPDAGDSAYTVTVTATDINGNTNNTTLSVTAYDPDGANGYATKTCINNSTAGTGQPTGCTDHTVSDFGTAFSTYGGNGKAIWFKCGDTFSHSGDTNVSWVSGSVGAYGACVGTTSGLPTFQKTGSGNLINFSATASDVRIADLSIDGNTHSGQGITTAGSNGTFTTSVPSQITILNVHGTALSQYFDWVGKQWALVNSSSDTCGNNCIGTFVNYLGYGWPSSSPSQSYQFLAGNYFYNGTSGNSSYETVRNAFANRNFISNNDFWNAGPFYSLLKLHQGNGNNSDGVWNGGYSELNVISDNNFQGSSGSNPVELSPESDVRTICNGSAGSCPDDERVRNILFERNVINGTTSTGEQLLISGQNMWIFDNVFLQSSGTSAYGPEIQQRSNVPSFPTTGIEIYNNTCFSSGNYSGNPSCVKIDSSTAAGGVTVKNTLAYYSVESGCATVTDSGSGNTISNNTANCLTDPSFTNGSGNMNVATDFVPTANYTGGTTVPVIGDFFGTPWAGTWDYGAVHH